jgi:septal ring factor EnvC (AmiA/AmiB activator)
MKPLILTCLLLLIGLLSQTSCSSEKRTQEAASIAALETRLTLLESEKTELESRLDEAEEKLAQAEEKLTQLEEGLDDYDTAVTSYASLRGLDDRLGELEDTIFNRRGSRPLTTNPPTVVDILSGLPASGKKAVKKK